MAQAAVKPWTLDELFAWQERQEDRYEPVDGFPVRMMSVETNRHGGIVSHVIGEVRNRLRGSGHRPVMGAGATVTATGQIRRPDAGVECGRSDPDGHTAADPRLVVEVLSPSTRDFDAIEKLAEYKAVESLDTILYVEPNRPEVAVWRREPDRSWARELVEDVRAAIPLPSLDIELPLAGIYDKVERDTSVRPVPPPGR